MPTISVVIPVFNGERFIGEAIRSVLGQTFRDLEIIVVDDGSTDRTASAVSQFPAPVSYYRQENSGAGVARNFGVSVARGEWIAFLDADDIWYPSKLAVQLQHAVASPDRSFFYSDMDTIDDNGHLIQKGVLSAKMRRRKRKDTLTCLLFDGLPLPYPSTVLLRKDLFLKSGGFNPSFRWKYHEDAQLFARIARLCTIHFIPQGLVKYRIYRGSRLEDLRIAEWNWRALLACLQESARDEPEQELLAKAFHREYSRYLSNQGKRCLREGDYREARLFFLRSFLKYPLCPRNWTRWALSFAPGLRAFYANHKTKRRSVE
jgi:glycosyltransferase involved in cell wall biosynthesis